MKPASPAAISWVTLLKVFLLFFSVPLAFAIYTDNRWEDFYITFRASKNLVLGHGLVFTEGERIHSFTSPIGVLLPALCSWLVGVDRDDGALWLFRLMSMAALGAAGMLVYVVLQKRGVSPLATWVLLFLAAIDAKTVMFSSNGQEPAFVILALSLSLYALTIESKRTALLLGVAWGGVMWSRPDGFVYAGALALAVLVFKAGLASEHGRIWLLRQYAYAACLAAVIYLPWFAWAWSYYGSPIPHTVTAKGLHKSFWTLMQSNGFYWIRFQRLRLIFGPSYLNYGGWYSIFLIWNYLLWLFAALPLFLPFVSRLTRALSAAFIITSFYLIVVTPFPCPWYLPNGAWFGFLAIGLAFHDLCFNPAARARTGRFCGLKWPWLCVPLVGIAVMVQLLVLGCVFQQIRDQQRLIEFGERKAIGLWLRQHAETPRDTVFLEPLGYIGYYSNLKMYDYPGLSSEEMVEARRKLNTDDWVPLIEMLRPDWIVLRPDEFITIHNQDSSLLARDYQLVQVFDCSREVQALTIQGKGILMYDQDFGIFHRRR